MHSKNGGVGRRFCIAANTTSTRFSATRQSLFGNQVPMEKQQPDERHGVFDDDELDNAIANADDTGMVRGQQVVVEEEELENLPPETESNEPEESQP
jgi:hypothetical protein